MKLKDLSINKRLFLALILLLLCFIGVFAYVFYNLSELEQFDLEQQRIVAASDTAKSLEIDSLKIIANLQQYIATQSSDLVKEITNSRNSETQNIQKLKNLTELPEIVDLLDKYEDILPTRRLITDRIIEIISESGTGEDVKILSAEINKFDNSARTYLQKIVEIEKAESLKIISESYNLGSSIRQNTVVFVITVSILIILIFLLTINSIAKPVRLLTDVAYKISQGNLNVEIPDINYSNDMNTLLNAFKIMTSNIKNTQQNISSQNEELEESIDEIEDKNKDLVASKEALLNVLEDFEDEKKKVQIEKDKVDRIISSIGDGVFVIDNDRRITLFNPVCEALSEFTATEALGQPYNKILNFIDEETGKEDNDFITKSLKEGVTTSMGKKTVMINRSGKRIPVNDSAAPILDAKGVVIGSVVVFRDVTIERQIDKAKSEFVSLASHQLRTPLSAINWYSEMLINEDAGKINKDQKEYLEQVYNGNKRMIELVNSLLNVSRIELSTYGIDPKPTQITEIADSVIGELKPQIVQKELNFKNDYKDVPIVDLDPQLTRMIVQNLLSNAVKYTPAKGNVNLTITADKTNLNIEVADNGLGIPKSQQNRIFSKLFRADNVILSEVEGTGLGLYIVKAIVEEAGGTIKFESEEKKGTTFYVTLPLSGMKKKEGDKQLK